MSDGHRDILDALVPAYGLAADSFCEPLGHGLINQTLLLRSGNDRFVAQRINRDVFPRPADLVTNACLVQQQLSATPDYPLEVVYHLPDAQGCYLHGPSQNIRLMSYVENSISLESDPAPSQAEAAAVSYASFNAALATLDATRFITVIPDFHNLDWRMQQFVTAQREDRAGRRDSCSREIHLYSTQHALVREWRETMAQLPLRVCHNDTKLNNLLVHRQTGQALAVIDLDTSMAGHLMTDFGDMVRTSVSPEPEDSTRLDCVTARPELLTALCRGYLRGLGDLPTPLERRSLPLGTLLMPFIIGLRFLTDYLNGDEYFRTKHTHHNLERARNQFALYRSLGAARASLGQQLVDMT